MGLTISIKLCVGGHAACCPGNVVLLDTSSEDSTGFEDCVLTEATKDGGMWIGVPRNREDGSREVDDMGEYKERMIGRNVY